MRRWRRDGSGVLVGGDSSQREAGACPPGGGEPEPPKARPLPGAPSLHTCEEQRLLEKLPVQWYSVMTEGPFACSVGRSKTRSQ